MDISNLSKEELEARFRDEIRHHYDKKYSYRIRRVILAIAKLGIKHIMLRGIENFKTIPKNVPVIISATHKSHLDYLLIDCVLLKAIEYYPCTIAGKNLFHGYFKTMLPKVKGICLDRERIKEENLRKKENIIYLRTFYDYLTEEIFKKSETVLIYPEAGRSYNGKVGKLAHGIFGMAKRAINEDGKMAILPMGITYERVTEDEVFHQLQEIKAKEGMSKRYRTKDLNSFKLHALLQARGRVLFSFGPPIYVTQEDLRHLDELGEKIRTAMIKETVLTPVSLVCHAFGKDKSLKLTELYERMEREKNIAYKNGYKMIPGVDQNANPGYIWKLAKPHLAMPWRLRNILKRKGDTISVVKPEIVEYYANTVEHMYED
ncbi:1-acyl-sn-glycerol-3-phosphate acyltransferase [bacterium]|nr:1-acyl-sn-glycerol-3-phosphate acyltransferase [bacterium]